MVTFRLFPVLLLLIAARPLVAGVTATPYHDRWLARDKALHFTVSAVLAAGIYAGCRAGLNLARDEAVVIAPLWAVTVGFAKEDHDLKIKGTGFSFRDLVADLLGVCAGLAAVTLLDTAE